jgi:hypothetical protein
MIHPATDFRHGAKTKKDMLDGEKLFDYPALSGIFY